ncbi:hypothetical protein ACHAPU_006104 [Fusarium lateritium]
MHPVYTLYIGLEACVSEWRNDLYTTIRKTFPIPNNVQSQTDEKKPLMVEKQIEEGWQGSEKN